MMDKLTDIKNLLTILMKLITSDSKVSKFVTILPVTTATSEHPFLTFRRLKSYLKKS